MIKESNDAQNAPTGAVKRGRPQKREPGYVRVNVSLPAEEHKKLKTYCAQNSTTITDFLRKTIDDLPM